MKAPSSTRFLFLLTSLAVAAPLVAQAQETPPPPSETPAAEPAKADDESKKEELNAMVAGLKAADQEVIYGLGATALAERRYEEAAKWLQKSADAGDARAQAALAELYLSGWGVPKDADKARKLAEASSLTGCAEGLRVLAIMTRDGVAGLSGDAQTVVRLLEQAMKKGDDRAIFPLARFILMTTSSLRDEARGIALLKQGAEKNLAECTQDLAFAYEHAVGGLEFDLPQAINLYVKAIQQGGAEAPANLGVLYQKGNGVPQDDDRARTLFQLAVARGSVNGLVNLSAMNYLRASSPEEKEAAIRMMHEAKDKGATIAETILKKWEDEK